MSDRAAFFQRAGTEGAPEDASLGVEAWVVDLERAHDAIRRAGRALENGAQPVIDLAPPARSLEKVLAAIYDAFDHRDDRVTAVRRAHAALEESFARLSPGAALDPAIRRMGDDLREAWKHLGDAAARLAPLVPRPRLPAPDLVASRELPRLHEIDRPSIVPELRVPSQPPVEVLEAPPAPIARPKTFEELDAAMAELERRAEALSEPLSGEIDDDLDEPPRPAEGDVPPGFAFAPDPAESELDFLRARTRECFEEIAMIGVQRAPLLGDPWRTALILERRMMAAIDAIAAIGPPALSWLTPMVLDAPALDPSRAFGIAMTLGCFAGRDALAAAERVLFAAAPADPEFLASFAGALKIAPHALLPLSLRTLLADRFAGHRALAIDVLGHRGLATTAELARAAADAPAVAAAALPYLALSGDPSLASAIDAVLAQDDVELREAAWLALILSAHPRAREALEAGLAGPSAERAALFLALSGDARDAAHLLDAAKATPARPLITAVGWAGAASAVVPLMDFLTHEDDVVRAAAAYALDRITGAEMWEDAEIPAEEIAVEDPPEVDVGEPRPVRLSRLVSDPRDLPPEPAAEVIRRPTTDLGRWRAFWAERGPSYDLAARYRRGMPYTPLVSLRELDVYPCTPGERRSLQRELLIRTGQVVRLDPIDFVAVQEEALRAWEPIASRASTQPGTWTRPARR